MGVESDLLRASLVAARRSVFGRLTAERYIREAYRRNYGKELTLVSGQTFSEKLFRRMIALERSSDRTFTPLADKYLVRDYVCDRIGPEHLIRLLWVGRDPHEIPFDSLPIPHVIKTNHGSGGHIFVRDQTERDRIDRDRLRAHLCSALRENYYWRAREFQYFHIEPQVLIEEILDDGVKGGPLDYRCWCFHGEVRMIQIDSHDHGMEAFYDAEWRALDLRHRIETVASTPVEKPDDLPELIKVAQALARGIDFVRVDLYRVGGRIYFGELTFTPRAGIFKFRPESWDSTIGSWW